MIERLLTFLQEQRAIVKKNFKLARIHPRRGFGVERSVVEDKEAKIPAGERSPQWIRKITVVARFKAKEVSEQKLRNVLLTLIEPSRLDEGRIKYDLHQGINDPTRFIFYEIWEGKELLDRHAASSHVQNNIARVKDLLAEPPEVTLLDRIS